VARTRSLGCATIRKQAEDGGDRSVPSKLSTARNYTRDYWVSVQNCTGFRKVVKGQSGWNPFRNIASRQRGAGQSPWRSLPDGWWFLVAAGVVLRRHENQPRARFRRSLLRLRRPATSLQDAEDCQVSGEDANSDGCDYGDAENERHEERNQDQPPCQEFNVRLPQPGAHLDQLRLLQSTCVDARRY
jgi:hypothetical protein